MTITLRFQKLEERGVGIFLFKGECGFNLFVNELNSNIVDIIKCVIMSEDLESTLGSILLDVPTRGFTGTSDMSETG